jgi:hypothetical protein
MMGKYVSSYTAEQIEAAIAKARSLDDLTVVDGILYVNGEMVAGGIPQVSDITARNASSANMVWVIDASADETVGSGSALYVKVSDSWIKIAETEALDKIFSGSFTSSNSTGFSWSSNVLTITHNLNNSSCLIVVKDSDGNEVNYPVVQSANSFNLYFPVAKVPISGTYAIRITV